MEALPRSICLWNSSRNTKMSVVRALFHTPRLWNTITERTLHTYRLATRTIDDLTPARRKLLTPQEGHCS